LKALLPFGGLTRVGFFRHDSDPRALLTLSHRERVGGEGREMRPAILPCRRLTYILNSPGTDLILASPRLIVTVP